MDKPCISFVLKGRAKLVRHYDIRNDYACQIGIDYSQWSHMGSFGSTAKHQGVWKAVQLQTWQKCAIAALLSRQWPCDGGPACFRPSRSGSVGLTAICAAPDDIASAG